MHSENDILNPKTGQLPDTGCSPISLQKSCRSQTFSRLNSSAFCCADSTSRYCCLPRTLYRKTAKWWVHHCCPLKKPILSGAWPDSSLTRPSGKMIDINFTSFSLVKSNIYARHPTPDRRSTNVVNNTGCGLSNAETIASTKRIPNGIAKSFLFAILSVNGRLYGTGKRLYQFQQIRICR